MKKLLLTYLRVAELDEYVQMYTVEIECTVC